MKKALISSIEPRETGYRVAEVCSQTFEVASPLFWVDCADDVVADQFWYDPETQTFIAFPQSEEVVVDGAQPTSQGAQNF